MKSSKVIISLVAGAATGALLGILFAPDKGYITRQKLAEKADDITSDVQEKLKGILDNVADKLKKGKDEADDFSLDNDEDSEAWKEEVSPIS
jgi:gas vesicle protein